MTLTEVMDSIADGKDINETALDRIRIMGFTNANAIPEADRLKWDTGRLAGVRAYNIEAFLDEAESDPGRIL